MTVLDHLVAVLYDAAIYNRHDLARPSVILWTDGERHWAKVANIIAQARRGFFALDASGVGDFSGPSTWIRYQLGKWEGDEVPVVYLPGIHRHQFRGAAGFPAEALHLYALQFQGQFCGQINGKDWTPTAMLSAEAGGLGLKVAADRATKEALSEQLGAVLQTPVKELRGRHLEASDFHELAAGDPVRLLFDWMADPTATAQKAQPGQWPALISHAKKELGFDPAKDGLLVAMEKFTSEEGKWAQVWSRYEEAASSFPGVRKALDLIQSSDLFSNNNPRIPANNLRLEGELRGGLTGLAEMPPTKARHGLGELVSKHAERLKTVWVKLDEAPLAVATAHLGKMLMAMQQGMAGNDCAQLADSYLTQGWRVDSEARKAWSAARKPEDSAAIAAALKATYQPWLEELAERIQSHAAHYPAQGPAQAIHHIVRPGTVILFVDGLRADVARELLERWESAGITTETKAVWSALPTVTATAKPAWHPLAELLSGAEASENYEPTVKAANKLCRTAEFRKLVSGLGWKWFDATQPGDPSGSGWTEVGSFDRYGHDQGAKMAWRISEEIDAVYQRAQELLTAGWKVVRVVTDHGWLWLPGGLPKVDLPSHLTVSKWGRCARPDPNATHNFRQVSWFWGNEHPVVLAPGISVFQNGVEYAHGGLTLQEALTLHIEITASGNQNDAKVTITGTKWMGLRLRIEVTPSDASLRADIRRKAADASSSILGADDGHQNKGPDGDGRLSLFVEDDAMSGEAAILVIIRNGQVIAKKNLIIAED
jgi:hypothetical protein